MNETASVQPNFHELTEAELDESLSGPFNPPNYSETFSQSNYSSEYWSVHDQVTAALTILGVHDQYGDGDFCMNDDFGDSRFIGIELSTKRLWRSELIPLLQNILQRQPQAYRVYITHDLLDEESFHLMVQPSDVAGYFPVTMHRRAFGL